MRLACFQKARFIVEGHCAYCSTSVRSLAIPSNLVPPDNIQPARVRHSTRRFGRLEKRNKKPGGSAALKKSPSREISLKAYLLLPAFPQFLVRVWSIAAFSGLPLPHQRHHGLQGFAASASVTARHTRPDVGATAKAVEM